MCALKPMYCIHYYDMICFTFADISWGHVVASEVHAPWTISNGSDILHPYPSTISRPSNRSTMIKRTNITLTLIKAAWSTRIDVCILTISDSGGYHTIVATIFSSPYTNVSKGCTQNNIQKAWEYIWQNAKIDKNISYYTTQSIYCSINAPKWKHTSSYMSMCLFLIGCKRLICTVKNKCCMSAFCTLCYMMFML